MVLSRLNEDINYPDINSVDKEDINYESSLYQIDIDDIIIIIALGNVRFSFVTKGVLYVPIYLVIDDNIINEKLYLTLYLSGGLFLNLSI